MRTEELLDPAPVAALAALLDDGLPAPRPGEELPPLWHWVALPRWPVSSELGSDGHPARGAFLPETGLPRRMFAGGEVVFHRPLRVGGTVTRESTVESVTPKEGRSGKLVVVVVRTRLSDVDGLCVEERQDLIYRERGTPTEPGPAASDPAGAPLRRAGQGVWDFATDPTLLMRFSAATANPHRIHYDWPYATGVEGYPGLVVHGPLMTLAMAEVLRLDSPGDRVRRVTHRNRAPLFCGEPARVTARAGEVELTGPDGRVRTTLAVELHEEGTPHA
ncbi:FAS1-like dehydratase domain-containing protein [Amycolatopsis australiensis]|uniref:3-methylfumaryl-CoA hydratase n=1 Tax=Amycolatopsis australiensis TaxID=546364 RepID=A0A1K1S6Y0_9PSEU|nr:MaoC family dehydratase N-terminal domain-containing protein [Amycolatopsis australiensis]SFW79773.1 3-methylfumaryl-CoA hydratase [Amycolatopsis australiensis]